MSPESASSLVTGGDDDLRLLQLLVIVHAVPQIWNQLVVHPVIRRAAVHNHGDPIDVGLSSPGAAACHQPRKREFLVEVVIKVEGRLLALSTAAAADDAI